LEDRSQKKTGNRVPRFSGSRSPDIPGAREGALDRRQKISIYEKRMKRERQREREREREREKKRVKE